MSTSDTQFLIYFFSIWTILAVLSVVFQVLTVKYSQDKDLRYMTRKELLGGILFSLLASPVMLLFVLISFIDTLMNTDKIIFDFRKDEKKK